MVKSWRDYGKQKLISGALTILTAGIGQYYMWSSAMAKTAYATFRARCGFAMLLAIGKKVLGKIGKAVRSALISMGIQKFLAFLKKLIVDKVMDFIKNRITTICAVGSAAGLTAAAATTVGGIQKMTDAMSAIWEATGGNVEESKRLIQATVLVDAASSELHSTWINEVTIQATNVGRSMCNTFAETTQELKGQQSFLEGVSKNEFDLGNAQSGNDVVNFAKDVVDLTAKANQFVEATKTAMKWIGRLKTGAEVVTLVAHAPEYINNVGRSLEQQAHTIDMQKTTTSTSSNSPEETKEFKEFKDEMTTKVQRDVVDHIVSRVNSAWVQPLLQRKVEGVVRALGRETIKFISSVTEDDEDVENYPNAKLSDKPSSSTSSKRNRRNKKRNGEEVLQEHESYADQVNSIGGGNPAGLLEMQQMANYDGEPLVIDDETGTLTSKSKDGKFVVKPNGREPSDKSNARHLKITANADGTKHAVLTDGQSNTLFEGQPGNELNQCLYEAGARAKGVSTEEYIAGLKKHAINDDRAKYYYSTFLLSFLKSNFLLNYFVLSQTGISMNVDWVMLCPRQELVKNSVSPRMRIC